MKAIIESILAIIHIIFGIIAITSFYLPIQIISGVLSIAFLIGALKISDYDVYIMRYNDDHTSAKI